MTFYLSRPALFLLISIGLWPTGVIAHKGVKHKPHVQSAPAADLPDATNQVQATYLQQIDVLLKRGCGDCHSNETRYPWYASLPVVDTMIANDIAEAKEHLNISSGFPFEGHGNPVEDLKAIRDVLVDNSMPPWKYKLLHRSEVLSEKEKAVVLQWIDQSLIDLGTKK